MPQSPRETRETLRGRDNYVINYVIKCIPSKEIFRKLLLLIGDLVAINT